MEVRNQEVLDRVREELDRRPHIQSGVLFHMARQIDPSLDRIGAEYFHRAYVLPVRHELATQAPKRGRKRKGRGRQSRTSQRRGAHRPPQGAGPREEPIEPVSAPAREAPPLAAAAAEPAPQSREAVRRPANGAAPPDRHQVRAVFLRFAQDLAGAERPGDLVRAIAGLDRYLDQLLLPQS